MCRLHSYLFKLTKTESKKKTDSARTRCPLPKPRAAFWAATQISTLKFICGRLSETRLYRSARHSVPKAQAKSRPEHTKRLGIRTYTCASVPIGIPGALCVHRSWPSQLLPARVDCCIGTIALYVIRLGLSAGGGSNIVRYGATCSRQVCSLTLFTECTIPRFCACGQYVGPKVCRCPFSGHVYFFLLLSFIDNTHTHTF